MLKQTRKSANKPDRLKSLPIAVILVVSLLVAGCNPFKANNAQSQSQGQQGNPTGTDPSGKTASNGQQTAPGMPSFCAPGQASGIGASSSALESVVQPSGIVTPFVVYSGGKLSDGWSDASWGGVKPSMHDTGCLRNGHPTIKVTYPDAWGAFSVADWNNSNTVDTSEYSHLHFWVNGGEAGGQLIGAMVYTDGGEGNRLHVEKYIKEGSVQANKWQEVFIPFGDLGVGDQRSARVVFQDVSGHGQSPYFLDGIEFYRDNSALPTPVTSEVAITVDLRANRQPISPLIYGMSQVPEDVVKDGNVSLNRQGGNATSTYNWTLGNARNAGSDWEFRNYSREPNDPAYKQPSGLADMFFKADKRVGAETLLTVPMLGHVAKNDDNNTRSTGVPQEGGAPVSPGSEAIPGYDPRQNQQTISVKSVARKGSPFQDPPDKNAGAIYQDEWVNHMVHTFGKADGGGVRFYSMDNEPDLWADDTHVDLHPVRVGYDDLLKTFLDYAGAVKAVDKTVQVTGPVVSGWTGYWYSALDRGSDGFKTAADRKAHGGTPLLPWFLDQVHKHDQQAGQRTLDVLDIHYYPQGQGIYSNKADAKTAALRLRSTRSLWDPTYKDESWIARSEQSSVQLIPRMKGWIDQYYPGTKLGITEWNWGADETVNGALAIADVLGIYGREGVYLACYWTNPKLGSPGLNAFKMYRNFEGHNATFGDVSVLAQSPNPDKLSVFASEDTKTNQAKIIVINKTEKEQQQAHIELRGGTFQGKAKVYQLGNDTKGAIQALADVQVNSGSIGYKFPPYSITLLVVDKKR